MGAHLCRSERQRPACLPDILLQSEIGAIIRPPGAIIGSGTYEFNPRYDSPPDVNVNRSHVVTTAKKGPQNKLLKDKFVYVKKVPITRT